MEKFTEVREALEKENITFLEAEIQMIPKTYIKLDEKSSEKLEKIIENLQNLDDVMNVYHNWEEE